MHNELCNMMRNMLPMCCVNELRSYRWLTQLAMMISLKKKSPVISQSVINQSLNHQSVQGRSHKGGGTVQKFGKIIHKNRENQIKWEEKGQIGKKMESLPGACPAEGKGWLRPWVGRSVGRWVGRWVGRPPTRPQTVIYIHNTIIHGLSTHLSTMIGKVCNPSAFSSSLMMSRGIPFKKLRW